MPMITLEFDDHKVSDDEAQVLCEAVQQIVSRVTDIKDVFVYANSARIKVQVAPIEVFIWMSAHKIENADALIGSFKHELASWKQQSGFRYPINLSLIPMDWKVEIGI